MKKVFSKQFWYPDYHVESQYSGSLLMLACVFGGVGGGMLLLKIFSLCNNYIIDFIGITGFLGGFVLMVVYSFYATSVLNKKKAIDNEININE